MKKIKKKQDIWVKIAKSLRNLFFLIMGGIRVKIAYAKFAFAKLAFEKYAPLPRDVAILTQIYPLGL